MKKKLISLLLVLVLVLCLVPTAWATDALSIDGATLSGGTKIGSVKDEPEGDDLIATMCYDNEDVYLFSAPAGTAKVNFSNVAMYYDCVTGEKTGFGGEVSLGADYAYNAGYADDIDFDGDYTFTADDTNIFMIMDDEYAITVIIVQVEGGISAPAPAGKPDVTFTASVSGTAVPAEKIACTEGDYLYRNMWGSPVTDDAVPVYTVEIPAAAEKVTLAFSANVLVYNYKADGNFLSGTYDADYSEHTGTLYEGETQREVAVDANHDGVLDYIQVQTPYHEPYNYDNYFSGETDVLYAITFRYETPASGGDAGTVTPAASLLAAYQATGAMLNAQKDGFTWAGTADAKLPENSSAVNDWYVLGLARASYPIPKSYLDSVDAFTPADTTYPTDCARAVLAVTAAGGTVKDSWLIGAVNAGKMDASNNVIFGLLALDCGGYTVPAGGASRASLKDAILAMQQSDGGWGYSYQSGTGWATPWGTDVDTTAQAVQALAPYFNTDENVRAAVEKALTWLAAQQGADGTFGYMGSASVESTAQVIVALTALGLDPDTAFGRPVTDGLLAMSDSTGGFTFAGSYNALSTSQGYYALAAYYRYKAAAETDSSYNTVYTPSLYNMACTNHTAGDTTEADSSYHWYACKNCGCIISMERHKLTKTEAKAATCTAAGNIEYYYCSGCSRYYKDSAATEPVASSDVTVSALDHSYTKADCTTPATCRRCGVTKGTALGHNYVNGSCKVCKAPNPAADITLENAEKYVKVNEENREAFEAAVTGRTLVAQPAAKVVDPTTNSVVGAEVETIKANAAFTARGAEVKMVLDLSVKLSAGTVELGTMPETATPIEFIVTLPSDVLCTIPANKDVALFYDHNGTVGFISADRFDRTTGKLTFYADKFSTYTVVTVNRQTHYDPPAHRDTQSPRTADSGILLYGALSVMSLLGMGHMGKKRH